MAGETISVDRRLWLDADRENLVEDGDEAARWLWSPGPGHQVDKDEADSLGYKSKKKAHAA